MATGKPHTAFWLLALLIVGVLSHLYGRYGLEQELRKSAGLDLAHIQERKAAVTVLTKERDSLKSELNEVIADRNAIQNAHGKALQELRKKPPVYVQTTTIQIAECDSAKAASESFRREAQLERMARINCEEVTAIQDTALQNQETELIAADLRHNDDQAELKTISTDLDKEVWRKKAWRKVAIVTTSTSVILIAVLVLL